MLVVCDFHVHFYPSYDLDQAIASAYENFTKGPHFITVNDEKLRYCIFLTERFDCHFFKAFCEGKELLKNPKYRVTIHEEDSSIEIKRESFPALYIFPGRQIVTQEKLELLCLGADPEIADGLPFEEAFALVKAQGGIPVINWAPGKWFFSRGQLVKKILASKTPQDLFLCDTTLRPSFWLEPLIMKQARQLGYHVLAGTDPLPYPGEEKIIGSYGLILNGGFNPNQPLSSARTLIQESISSAKFYGRRSGPLDFFLRYVRHMRGR